MRIMFYTSFIDLVFVFRTMVPSIFIGGIEGSLKVNHGCCYNYLLPMGYFYNNWGGADILKHVKPKVGFFFVIELSFLLRSTSDNKQDV